jgi:hypothetical protein
LYTTHSSFVHIICTHTQSEEAAAISLAIMIQARIRGVRTRSYLARCAAAATVIQARIQALVRGIRTRSVLTRRAVAAAAATTIQARIRGAVTRNQVSGMNC